MGQAGDGEEEEIRRHAHLRREHLIGWTHVDGPVSAMLLRVTTKRRPRPSISRSKGENVIIGRRGTPQLKPALLVSQFAFLLGGWKPRF